MNYAVLLCAGRGSRFGEKKQLKKLLSIPLFEYSLKVFYNSNLIDRIVLVISEEDASFFQGYLKQKKFTDKVSFVLGGAERFDSVLNALSYIHKNHAITDNCKVLIHDSARPFLKHNYIKEILEHLKDFPAVSLGYKISDALKLADNNKLILEDIDRKNLWALTTPQGFMLKKLLNYYETKPEFIYDESSIFLDKNENVKIIEEGRYNIKVTYPEDFDIAATLMECFLQSENK